MVLQVNFDENAIYEILTPILSDHFHELETRNIGEKKGDENLYSVAHLADYLGVSEDWVYGMVRKREIPFFKVGNRNRFRRVEIDQWLEERASRPLPVNPVAKKLHLLGE